MLKRLVGYVLIVAVCLPLLLLSLLPVAAQGDPPAAQRVEITAGDGLVLVGDYYAPLEGDPAPAVLLLHMLGSRRQAWMPLVAPLTEAGYAVLAVDMRGHGETRGQQDWPLAEIDVQLWIDWLRTQPEVDPERVNLAGGSIGSNLALRGMANDERIVTAVALSPGLDYLGVTTADAAETISDRPVFLAVGQRDAPSNGDVRTLLSLLSGDVQVMFYHHGGHATDIFLFESDLAATIVAWLDRNN